MTEKRRNVPYSPIIADRKELHDEGVTIDKQCIEQVVKLALDLYT